ncbi:RsmE family RNA methyltransferase [Actinophytocola sp.]|uniref:RsmE family RNA methyltransferase n=1 Tax=Actinophytocola sp. TaxID=1872138 RepID=UPI002ED0B63E
MRPPLFLVSHVPTTLPDGEFRLSGLRGSRATRAQELGPGDEIVLGDGQGGTATAVVTSVGRGHLDLKVDAATLTPQPHTTINVIQGVTSADPDELAVAELTALGASEISVLARPSVAAALPATLWKHWQKVAREAAERSGRPWLPRIEFVYTHERLQRRLDWGDGGFLLDPSADTTASTVDFSGRTLLIADDPTPDLDGWLRRVRLDEHPRNARDAAVAAMTILAARG